MYTAVFIYIAYVYTYIYVYTPLYTIHIPCLLGWSQGQQGELRWPHCAFRGEDDGPEGLRWEAFGGALHGLSGGPGHLCHAAGTSWDHRLMEPMFLGGLLRQIGDFSGTKWGI